MSATDYAQVLAADTAANEVRVSTVTGPLSPLGMRRSGLTSMCRSRCKWRSLYREEPDQVNCVLSGTAASLAARESVHIDEHRNA